MTAQNTHASISQNSFGTGAKINLVVGTSSKKNGREKSETAAIILGLNDDDDTKLIQWLSKLNLDHILKKLEELGVAETEDMTLLDEEDLNSLNLKKIQMKKLKRAIAELEE